MNGVISEDSPLKGPAGQERRGRGDGGRPRLPCGVQDPQGGALNRQQQRSKLAVAGRKIGVEAMADKKNQEVPRRRTCLSCSRSDGIS